MTKRKSISLDKAFSRLRFLENRTPQTTEEESSDAFGKLADYRDGAIFIAHYAGKSEWERHTQGDEIVFVLQGVATLILLSKDEQIPEVLNEGELFVVPQGVWHRFETTKGVKLITVTPQPTEHSILLPEHDLLTKNLPEDAL